MSNNRFANTVLQRFDPTRPVLLLAIALLNACQSLPIAPPEAEIVSIQRHRFSLNKDQAMVGKMFQVEVADRDSLAGIGRYFGLGFDEISLANPDLDPWIPEPGNRVLLPLQFILPAAPRQGIVLNLSAKRLFYFPKEAPGVVFTYPVGIGREGWETPLGLTRIVAKKAHPSWTVPVSVRREHARKGDPLPGIVPAGPDNPLGDYAMRLGIPGYLIHGTNKPYGVGMEVSHGCVRLYPEDISRLFEQTPIGTRVRLVDQPYLVAWVDDRLYLQAYQPVHKNQRQQKRLARTLMAQLKRIERRRQLAIAWDRVEAVLARVEGVPTPILANDLARAELPRAAHPPENYSDTIPGPLTADAWSLQVANFEDEQQAQRLAAILNHQGPPIPAHALGDAVVAGPFKQEREAKSAARRILIDFSLESQIVRPGTIQLGGADSRGLFAPFQSLLE